jgi:phage terminase small subunit
MKGRVMKREELIEMLEQNESTEHESEASTNEGGIGEAMQMAVAKIREKKTKTGRVFGVKPEEKERRLTPQQQLFVNALMAGKSKTEAYRGAYNVRTGNDATVYANANRLIKDRRIAGLLTGLDETLKEKVIEDAVKTRRFVMERLHDRVLNAKTESAELKALELMGRAVAMFTDNVDQKVRQIDPKALKEELKGHLLLLNSEKAKRTA